MFRKAMKTLLLQEKGQATVLMVGALVVLLGMAALTVDVGYLFFQKRHYQNIADAAALAAAQELPNTVEAEKVAIEYAVLNNADVIPNVTFENGNKRVAVSLSGEQNTYFARVLSANFSNVKVGVFAAAEKNHFFSGTGIIENYQKELIIKYGNLGETEENAPETPTTLNININFPAMIYSRDYLIAQHFAWDVQVNGVDQVKGEYTHDISDTINLFQSTQQVEVKPPPITKDSVGDNLAYFAEQGYEVMVLDKSYNFVKDDPPHTKINLDGSDLDFSDYATGLVADGTPSKGLVVFFGGKEIQLKGNSGLIGADLLILDCILEIKDGSNINIGGTLYQLNQGPNHELEFKNNMTGTFGGPILVDGKVELKKGAQLTFNYTIGDMENLPSLDRSVSLVQ